MLGCFYLIGRYHNWGLSWVIEVEWRKIDFQDSFSEKASSGSIHISNCAAKRAEHHNFKYLRELLEIQLHVFPP